jgi:hypothetical protein
MNKVKAFLLICCFALFGCSNDTLRTFDDIKLLANIPKKINDSDVEVLNIIPKGKSLEVNSKHYMKDFLVLEVTYNKIDGFVIFDNRKMQIIQN